MHLLETYALQTGSKIKKPFILTKYFPTPTDKYVTIQNSSGMVGKCYDYFQEVVNFLYKKLDSYGYKIIQIGSKEDRPLNKVIHTQGLTDIHQTAFILKNSKLHLGNDSFAIHMASAFGIPLVGLYSVSSPEIAGPFWKNENQICLTPENWKPSFNPNESPKRVNEIPIEKIINSIEKLLFNNVEINIKSIFVGERCHNTILENFPNQVIPPQLFPKQATNIRFDYIDNITNQEYESTLHNLSNRPCGIITDKTLNLEPFLQFKDNIQGVFYNVTKNIDINFINYMNNLGLKNFIIFNLNDNNSNDLEQRKISTIDLPQIIEINKRTVFNFSEKDNLFYKTNKLLFYNNQVFAGRTAQKQNMSLSNINDENIFDFSKIQDLETFIEEDLKFSFVFQK